jgi:hypothetical protein
MTMLLRSWAGILILFIVPGELNRGVFEAFLNWRNRIAGGILGDEPEMV